MEERDGGQDGVLSRAGEEELGRAIQNGIFLCFAFLLSGGTGGKEIGVPRLDDRILRFSARDRIWGEF